MNPQVAFSRSQYRGRVKVRAGSEVVDRCGALTGELRAALERLPAGADDSGVVQAVWRGERLGTLLWALRLGAMAPYDRPFDHRRLLEPTLAEPRLRDSGELEGGRETARLWHWRARMSLLEADPAFELPPPWRSCQELVASVAARGHEHGLLPEPVNGDFSALGFAYRWATPPELAELGSIAFERHLALAWLCDSGRDWDDVSLDT
jgi:hypothetical protein